MTSARHDRRTAGGVKAARAGAVVLIGLLPMASAAWLVDIAASAVTGQPVAVYMGLTALPAIRRRLLDGGLAPETPAAVIEAATTPLERVLVTTLGELAERAMAEKMASPALVVVGGIVAMRARLTGGGA